MTHPDQPCACERGDKCTPVGLCAAQGMVEDQTQELRDEIERLRRALDAIAAAYAAHPDSLRAHAMAALKDKDK